MWEEDFAPIEVEWARGRDGLAGGPRHAASAQSIYFAPGSLAQHRALEAAFRALGKAFPTAQEARQIYERSAAELSLYGFRVQDEVWRIVNLSPERFPPRFGAGDMRLVFETATPLTARIPARAVTPALRLLESLGARKPVDEILALATAVDLECLVAALWAGGVVAPCPQGAQVDKQALPAFLSLGHASFAVRSADTLAVFDPVALPGNLHAGGPDRPLMPILRAADFVVISHHHWDHLHFQTLCQLRKDTCIIVPRCSRASFANPPIASYLQSLGFTNVLQCAPGDSVALGDMTLRLFPFFGEPFGLGSTFDAFTYHLSFRGRTLYGSVDACSDERGAMEDVIAEVAQLGDLDVFLFGSSGQRHRRPYMAAGLRHFSNELLWAPHLIRYHPEIADVERWARVLKPRCLVSYADFGFGAAPGPDLAFDALGRAAGSRDPNFVALADRLALPVIELGAMQGVD